MLPDVLFHTPGDFYSDEAVVKVVGAVHKMYPKPRKKVVNDDIDNDIGKSTTTRSRLRLRKRRLR